MKKNLFFCVVIFFSISTSAQTAKNQLVFGGNARVSWLRPTGGTSSLEGELGGFCMYMILPRWGMGLTASGSGATGRFDGFLNLQGGALTRFYLLKPERMTNLFLHGAVTGNYEIFTRFVVGQQVERIHSTYPQGELGLGVSKWLNRSLAFETTLRYLSGGNFNNSVGVPTSRPNDVRLSFGFSLWLDQTEWKK